MAQSQTIGHQGLRRAGIVALAVLLAIAGVVALIAFLSGRDSSGVPSSARGPGQAFPDQGNRHLRPGERPATPYDSNPPTSGPHVPTSVTHDAATLDDDQLLTALEAGNVVLVYGTAQPPAALRALANDVAGPFDPPLAQTGQSVILARRPGSQGIVALAWRHQLRAVSPGDPALRAFAEAWLGVGVKGK